VDLLNLVLNLVSLECFFGFLRVCVSNVLYLKHEKSYLQLLERTVSLIGLHNIPRIPFFRPVIWVDLDLPVVGGTLLGNFLKLLQSKSSFVSV
jgi:hypothetical protein